MDLTSITYYFTHFGAIAIFVMVLLEYLNLPGYPAGVIMPLSGIMAANGNIHFTTMMLITVFAGSIGSLGLRKEAVALRTEAYYNDVVTEYAIQKKGSIQL